MDVNVGSWNVGGLSDYMHVINHKGNTAKLPESSDRETINKERINTIIKVLRNELKETPIMCLQEVDKQLYEALKNEGIGIVWDGGNSGDVGDSAIVYDTSKIKKCKELASEKKEYIIADLTLRWDASRMLSLSAKKRTIRVASQHLYGVDPFNSAEMDIGKRPLKDSDGKQIKNAAGKKQYEVTIEHGLKQFSILTNKLNELKEAKKPRAEVIGMDANVAMIQDDGELALRLQHAQNEGFEMDKAADNPTVWNRFYLGKEENKIYHRADYIVVRGREGKRKPIIKEIGEAFDLSKADHTKNPSDHRPIRAKISVAPTSDENKKKTFSKLMNTLIDKLSGSSIDHESDLQAHNIESQVKADPNSHKPSASPRSDLEKSTVKSSSPSVTKSSPPPNKKEDIPDIKNYIDGMMDEMGPVIDPELDLEFATDDLENLIADLKNDNNGLPDLESLDKAVDILKNAGEEIKEILESHDLNFKIEKLNSKGLNAEVAAIDALLVDAVSLKNEIAIASMKPPASSTHPSLIPSNLTDSSIKMTVSPSIISPSKEMPSSIIKPSPEMSTPPTKVTPTPPLPSTPKPTPSAAAATISPLKQETSSKDPLAKSTRFFDPDKKPEKSILRDPSKAPRRNEVIMLKNKVLANLKELIGLKKKLEVSFNQEVDVKVSDTKSFKTPLNTEDRVDNKYTMKKQGGISLRNVNQSIRSLAAEKTNTKLMSDPAARLNITLKDITANSSLDQLIGAIANSLPQELKPEKTTRNFVITMLRDTLLEIPSDNLSLILNTLIEKIKSKNKQEKEVVGREMFAAMSKTSNLGKDLNASVENAVEFPELDRDLRQSQAFALYSQVSKLVESGKDSEAEKLLMKAIEIESKGTQKEAFNMLQKAEEFLDENVNLKTAFKTAKNKGDTLRAEKLSTKISDNIKNAKKFKKDALAQAKVDSTQIKSDPWKEGETRSIATQYFKDNEPGKDFKDTQLGKAEEAIKKLFANPEVQKAIKTYQSKVKPAEKKAVTDSIKTNEQPKKSKAEGAVETKTKIESTESKPTILDRLKKTMSPNIQSSTIGKLITLPDSLKDKFSDVDSSELQSSNGKNKREDFLNDPNYETDPPIILSSDFVPEEMTKHLMEKKKKLALKVKYCAGDSITNMEGAMHTFVTPVCKINMTGDYKHDKGHSIASLDGQRQVILSASIHPDFESSGEDEVVMRLVEVKEQSVEGKILPEDFKILSQAHDPKSQAFKDALPGYEDQLQAHMVYHLTSAHKLPALAEVKKIMKPEKALAELESIILSKKKQNVSAALADKFVNLNDHVISLEALYNIYSNQIRNEFSVLEGTLPQGYVYTIDPPAIFAEQIGSDNVNILNRLQLLAIKEVNANSGLKNLKILGFNSYADRECIALYSAILPENVPVVDKAKLFEGPNGEYSNSDNYALVEHNNSDAFGQNIENEKPSSKDGVIGSFSDASHALKRTRPDLTSRSVNKLLKNFSPKEIIKDVQKKANKTLESASLNVKKTSNNSKETNKVVIKSLNLLELHAHSRKTTSGSSLKAEEDYINKEIDKSAEKLVENKLPPSRVILGLADLITAELQSKVSLSEQVLKDEYVIGVFDKLVSNSEWLARCSLEDKKEIQNLVNFLLEKRAENVRNVYRNVNVPPYWEKLNSLRDEIIKKLQPIK